MSGALRFLRCPELREITEKILFSEHLPPWAAAAEEHMLVVIIMVCLAVLVAARDQVTVREDLVRLDKVLLEETMLIMPAAEAGAELEDLAVILMVILWVEVGAME